MAWAGRRRPAGLDRPAEQYYVAVGKNEHLALVTQGGVFQDCAGNSAVVRSRAGQWQPREVQHQRQASLRRTCRTPHGLMQPMLLAAAALPRLAAIALAPFEVPPFEVPPFQVPPFQVPPFQHCPRRRQASRWPDRPGLSSAVMPHVRPLLPQAEGGPRARPPAS